MPRTSLVHYIAPSAITVTPNCNSSANDLAVYIARQARIKVYSSGIEALWTVDASFQEWTLTGRNRRLADLDKPYTIYARLSKTDRSDGYLVFAAKNRTGDMWTDKYNYVTVNGLSDIEGAVTSNSHWYIRMGDVSLPEGGLRSVTLDTGILGTDQYNTDWSLNPDDLPLRVELDCTIDEEDAGNTPYVLWDKSLLLSATLVKGWDGTDIDRFHHWEISRNTDDEEADASWLSPERASEFAQTGRILLEHVHGLGDDFNNTFATTFTVTAMGTPEQQGTPVEDSSDDSDSSDEPDVPTAYVPIASESISIFAETSEKYQLVLSSGIMRHNVQTGEYTPREGITLRIRTVDQYGSIRDITYGLFASMGLAVEYAAAGSDDWSRLALGGVDGDTVVGVIPVSVFDDARQDITVRLVRIVSTETEGEVQEGSFPDIRTVVTELTRTTVFFVEGTEDTQDREWIFLRSQTAINFGAADSAYPEPSLISGGEVRPAAAASGADHDRNQAGWVPQGWWDEEQGVNDVYYYEYASYRDFVHGGDSSDSSSSGEEEGGHWGPFTNATLWNHYKGGVNDSDIIDAIQNEGSQLYLSKVIDDAAAGVITFLKGLVSEGEAVFKGLLTAWTAKINEIRSHNFTGWGVADTGFELTNNYDGTGASGLVVDYIYARMKLVAEALELKKYEVSAGDQMYSMAANYISRTEYYDGNGDTVGWSTVKVPWLMNRMPFLLRHLPNALSFFASTRVVRTTMNDTQLRSIRTVRCYFLAEDDDREIENWWRVGDLARCQTLNVVSAKRDDFTGVTRKAGNIFWWRKVKGVSANTGDVEYRYINAAGNIITQQEYAALTDEEKESYWIKRDYNGTKIAEDSSYTGPVTLDDGKKYHWIDVEYNWLSEHDGRDYAPTAWSGAAILSDIPCAGDTAVQFGHDSDPNRMNLMTLELNGLMNADAPCVKIYRGIYTFDLNKCWWGGKPRKMTLSPSSGYEFYGPSFRFIEEHGVAKVPYERGEWTLIPRVRDDYPDHGSVRKCHYYDQVSHNGSLWLCVASSLDAGDAAHWVKPQKFHDESGYSEQTHALFDVNGYYKDNGDYISDAQYNGTDTLPDGSTMTEEHKAECGRVRNYVISEPSESSADWRKQVSKGGTGDSPIQLFKWTTESSPTISAPTVSAADYIAGTNLQGWSKYAPNRQAGDMNLYMSQNVLVGGTTLSGSWSVPAQISGPEGTPGEDAKEKEWIYIRMNHIWGESDTLPANISEDNEGVTRSADYIATHDDFVPYGWNDNAQPVSQTYPYVYASWRDWDAATERWGAFSTPILWSNWGRNGIDGDGLEYVFIRTNSDTAPTINTKTSGEGAGNAPYGGKSYTDDEFLPLSSAGRCTDDAVGPDSTHKYEWVMIRSKGAPDSSGVRTWNKYGSSESGTPMSLWAKWSEDGQPGETYLIIPTKSSLVIASDATVVYPDLTARFYKFTGGVRSDFSAYYKYYFRGGSGPYYSQSAATSLTIPSNLSFTPGTALVIEIYGDSTMATVLAQQDIPIVRNGAQGADGDDAVSVILTPPTLIINQNITGSDNLAPSSTNNLAEVSVQVKKGSAACTITQVIAASNKISDVSTLRISNSPSSGNSDSGTWTGLSTTTFKLYIKGVGNSSGNYFDTGQVTLTLTYTDPDTGTSVSITDIIVKAYINLLGTWSVETVNGATRAAGTLVTNTINDGIAEGGVIRNAWQGDITASATGLKAEFSEQISKAGEFGHNLFGFNKGVVFNTGSGSVNPIPYMEGYGIVVNGIVDSSYRGVRIMKLGLNGIGGYLTVSFMAKTASTPSSDSSFTARLCMTYATKATYRVVDAANDTEASSVSAVPISTTWRMYKFYFYLPPGTQYMDGESSQYNGMLDIFGKWGSGAPNIYVRHLNVERGEVANDFIEAEEDIAYIGRGQMIDSLTLNNNDGIGSLVAGTLDVNGSNKRGYSGSINVAAISSGERKDFLYKSQVGGYFQIKAGRIYTVSFWAKSGTAGLNISCYLYNPSSGGAGLLNAEVSSAIYDLGDMIEYATKDGLARIALGTSWKQYFIHLWSANTFKANLIALGVARNFNQAQSYTVYIADIQLQEGYVMGETDFRSKIEQNARCISLVQQTGMSYAGINLENGTIDLIGNRVNFTSPDLTPYIKVGLRPVTYNGQTVQMPYFIFLAPDGVTELYNLGLTGIREIANTSHQEQYIPFEFIAFAVSGGISVIDDDDDIDAKALYLLSDYSGSASPMATEEVYQFEEGWFKSGSPQQTFYTISGSTSPSACNGAFLSQKTADQAVTYKIPAGWYFEYIGMSNYFTKNYRVKKIDSNGKVVKDFAAIAEKFIDSNTNTLWSQITTAWSYRCCVEKNGRAAWGYDYENGTQAEPMTLENL